MVIITACGKTKRKREETAGIIEAQEVVEIINLATVLLPVRSLFNIIVSLTCTLNGTAAGLKNLQEI